VQYRGLRRLESFPYPAAALREGVLNALTHKDYSGGTPIQISVYEDGLTVWNEGQLPDNWTVADLTKKHPSKPFNPSIAQAMFAAGLIEAWGRGTLKIFSECRAANLPDPTFGYGTSGFWVTFKANRLQVPPPPKAAKGTPFQTQSLEEVSQALAAAIPGKRITKRTIAKLNAFLEVIEPKSIAILNFMKDGPPMKRAEIMKAVGLTNQTNNVKRYFSPLVMLQLVENLLSDRPSSRHQTYALTNIGNKISTVIRRSSAS
jgi:predicted HTH transcriptional regulator